MANKSRYRSLTRRADFLALKKSGNILYVNSWMLVNWRKADSPILRCGWTIPGHIGSSVLRNRLKRWGKEYVRRWSASLGERGLDMNVILKRKEEGFYSGLKHQDFDVALERMAARLQKLLP